MDSSGILSQMRTKLQDWAIWQANVMKYRSKAMFQGNPSRRQDHFDHFDSRDRMATT